MVAFCVPFTEFIFLFSLQNGLNNILIVRFFSLCLFIFIWCWCNGYLLFQLLDAVVAAGSAVAAMEISIAKCSHLLSNMNYLDETRVGIWGWGYGGYVTAMVLGAQQPVYKCGVSVSPITDWLHYSKYNFIYHRFFCYLVLFATTNRSSQPF